MRKKYCQRNPKACYFPQANPGAGEIILWIKLITLTIIDSVIISSQMCGHQSSRGVNPNLSIVSRVSPEPFHV